MVKYCLDTGILIAFFRNDIGIVEKIKSLQEKNEIFITCINLCELYKGAYKSSNLKYELSFIENIKETIFILEFDAKSCNLFGKDFVRLQKEGKVIDDFDLIISSIAKKNECIMVTRNKKHFENTGIKIEVW